jgi:hypothetical protein
MYLIMDVRQYYLHEYPYATSQPINHRYPCNALGCDIVLLASDDVCVH